MTGNEIGKRIAQKRKELGLTQRELADKLHITDRAVSRWERGAGTPDISLLAPLAQVLRCSIDELMTGKAPAVQAVDSMDDYWKRWKKADELRQQRLARRAPLLGRWLTVLAWLILPSVIAENLVNMVSEDWHLPGMILSALCSVAYGLILLRVASEDSRYRIAGILRLAVMAVHVVLELLPDIGQWQVLLLIPAAVAALVGEYRECMAHSAVCEDLKTNLPERWEGIWKGFAVGAGLAAGGALLRWLLTFSDIYIYFRGGSLYIGISAMAIFSLIKLITLFQTAAAFRNYPV